MAEACFETCSPNIRLLYDPSFLLEGPYQCKEEKCCQTLSDKASSTTNSCLHYFVYRRCCNRRQCRFRHCKPDQHVIQTTSQDQQILENFVNPLYTIQELLDNIPPITIKDLKECGILTEMGYQGSSEQDDQTAITDQEVSVPPTKRSKYDYSHCLEDDDILRAEVIVPRRSCTSEDDTEQFRSDLISLLDDSGIHGSIQDLCPYNDMDECPYQDDCLFVHGDLCNVCRMPRLHPLDLNRRIQHATDCLALHEKQSLGKECGICQELIFEEDSLFGLLQNCKHSFCLDCLNQWQLLGPNETRL
ncbi:probable E3 ubiquitin-protein ligase makorin-1 [Biomphalaria glabrata]|uniref:RING-type E3 ubiquitin transferase n=1 Tax=Biomphalaria glabrata TaxID=6526 RepID=A0A9W3A4T1_BIOGL|nr:probable E3 ubiquitin-protein ligase makorin-1 [Biomphalaria glabrata]KAI8771914.1 E3 ubiquitin-protein ligase makorin-1 [Biomphalaria glabrata]